MSPLISSPTFLFHRSATLSNDVEMLQTDVMRFFAILCLCLMAIFALVKALPLSPPADRPTLVEPPNLKAEAASLQKEARNDIKEREAMVARIVKDIKDKRRIRSELKAQIKNETRNFEKIQAALDQITVKLNRPVQQNQQIPGNTPPAPVARQPAQKGFTLRFASDTALETLISRKKVHFFALAGQKTWQLKLAHGRPVYTAVKIPSKIYEMETTTVPANYVAVFSRQVAAFGRSTVTWGVTLPDQTAASINRLIEDRDGGDLIIMPDGEVILN